LDALAFLTILGGGLLEPSITAAWRDDLTISLIRSLAKLSICDAIRLGVRNDVLDDLPVTLPSCRLETAVLLP
jgi:hypothetical protein